MATTHRRRRTLIASRRPVAEEGEEGGEDCNGNELDDSLSDDSGLSEDEEEEDEDDEDEDLSEEEEEVKEKEEAGKKPAAVEEVVKGVKQISIERPPPREAKTNGTTSKTKPPAVSTPNRTTKTPFKPTGPGRLDTEFMLNGIQVDDAALEEAVDFDDIDGEGEVLEKKPQKEPEPTEPSVTEDQPPEEPKQQVRHETLFERRRREHEEYKQKRDADPAFVPNRGAFFMHDSRHHGAGGNGFKPFGRGGRGGRGGMFGRGGMGFGRYGRLYISNSSSMSLLIGCLQRSTAGTCRDYVEA